MNVWRMKTFKESALRFTEKEYIAIDEQGIDHDYGVISEAERAKLFHELDEHSIRKRKWGLIKRYFDDFYDNMEIGDIVIIGTGQTTSYNVNAIVKVTSHPYFISQRGCYPRHRRSIELLWLGNTFTISHWGQSKKLERLNTVEKLEDYIELFTEIYHYSVNK